MRVPLHKGLQGIRLFLINKRDQQDLSEVKTLKDLQRFPTGSGEQWSITPVLRDSGFHVVTAEGQRELYEMLRLRRMITFGRGVFEIFEELEKYGAGYPELVVEDHLALFVPLPVYFFVSPRHPELARHIETGLQRMIEDGSFDEHFLKYHGEDIEKASLSRRTLFRIPNPHLSAKTPTENSPLWFNPSLLTQDLN
ncbi:hypothetical protein [Labrenzia sp. VG12]|uniref:hypothetical protein n=1 Tax=Labrenzia sp. VG12 TaxID=2021862 RepID=UPI000B8C02AC|nr:hypothetical protein [Labrenzia sp. VG12]ASP36397.1 hypothetical protein CHH27_26730 [Labrenzia sp. VG12]